MKNSSKLQVALVQADLVWEAIDLNKKHLEEKINSIQNNVDLIILPELFTTGFTMNTLLAETMNGTTISWMQELAKSNNTAITGSIIIEENSSFYNRLLFVHPTGKIDFYDKHHTFTLAKEHKAFNAGKEQVIIEYKGWKIRPLVCYDLRFPVWARNTENYDILFYVASWPKTRIAAWDTLLKARAIENMSYTIGVNRVGVDAKNLEYTGNSACYDSLGNCVTKNNTGEETILYCTLEKEKQQAIRDKFQFLEDRDSFIFQ
ncbi:amidohydrolase [Tenacibaculum holothuriorum]|uniref:Omega-amidase YafV n=1 Tax=Tenacibaculum holothuriorum TaxID=1635173 RepID=A0A1Y2P9K3_9FLAO|nr:amidohydrolase [Tenacibaculum holothuriorum]OSY87122.1 amidohydrolase [Tenacibaculum holothuriorum]